METEDFTFNDGTAGGPDRWIIAAILEQTILDARAIARRNPYPFLPVAAWSQGGRKNLPTAQKILIIEREYKALRQWINSHRFSFYVERLGYDADMARRAIEQVIEGGKTKELFDGTRGCGERKYQTIIRSGQRLPLPVRFVQEGLRQQPSSTFAMA